MNSSAPSPVSGKRAAQTHPARAAYSINHVKLMVPPEGRPSIPTGNVGSSKQNGRSHTGNNERKFQKTKYQSNMAKSKEDPPQYKHTADLHRSHRPSGQHQPWKFNCTTYRPNSPGASFHITPAGMKLSITSPQRCKVQRPSFN